MSFLTPAFLFGALVIADRPSAGRGAACLSGGAPMERCRSF